MSKGYLISIISIILGWFSGYFWWTTTPEYAAKNIINSIESRNLIKFRKYVNLKSVSNSFLKSKELALYQESFITPLQVEYLSMQIEELLENGAIYRVFISGETSIASLSEWGFCKENFREITKKENHGSIELWTLRYKIPELDFSEFFLTIKFRDVGRYYQFVGFKDLDSLFIDIIEQRNIQTWK